MSDRTQRAMLGLHKNKALFNVELQDIHEDYILQ